ncbi:unnamed protein product, partial [Musa acuminata subsp. burmannicoides]
VPCCLGSQLRSFEDLHETWPKLTMQAASIFFLVGVILNAAAVNIAMLIIGRILLGVVLDLLI